jgi:large subunit ribosomal protein L2
MILKKINPTTSSLRQLKLLNKSHLSKINPIKYNTCGLINSGGRNNLGRITSYHKGGGHKKLYRKIDFNRINLQGIVTSIEYDPNRTANIACIYDSIKSKYSYIISPKGLKIGDLIKSGIDANVKIGHSLILDKIPLGSFIHNISLVPGERGKLARAAGNYAQLIQKDKKYAKIKLRSGEQRFIFLNCTATLGVVSNEHHNLISLGKAGRSRWLNRKPIVRGVAMNPVDHPHGGGQGKTSGGRPSVTPWGRPTKGQPTSKSKNKLILINRKKK